MRGIGQTQQQVADKLRVSQYTVHKELNIENNIEEAPQLRTNSRGQERPATYKKKEEDVTAVSVEDERVQVSQVPLDCHCASS